MERKLVHSSIMSPDGTILTSRYRHDYASYVDDNGETYINDGGIDYIRRSINKESFIDMSLYTDSNHADLRFYLERGSRGINGDEPLKYIKIKDMTDAHLKATIEYEKEFRPDNPLLPIYREEVKYRKKL